MVSPSIHDEVLKVQADNHNWSEFQERLLERYDLNDLLQLSNREFMEWVKHPKKGRNTLVLLQELEKRFAWLSALDWTVLNTSKVLLFVKSVDLWSREGGSPLGDG